MKIPLLGFASGIAAGDTGTGTGPVFLKKHLLELEKWSYYWYKIFHPKYRLGSIHNTVAEISKRLAKVSSNLIQKQQPFVTIGGDHSCAIGTWKGVSDALKSKGDIGLIWIDAHMDAHTPETSPSGNIHGMPLATLMGYGDQSLINLSRDSINIKPHNICLIGIRSYEREEYILLQRLGVRLYFMQDIASKGINAVMHDAVMHVSKNTIGYGLSIDLDSIDPTQVEGVGTPVSGGINTAELINGLSILKTHPPLAAEIAEYNPNRDLNLKTIKILIKILEEIQEMWVQ